MKFKKFLVFQFFLYLICAKSVFCAALSFSDCVNEAKKNNKELVALNFDKEAILHRIQARKANYYPEIDATAGANSIDARDGGKNQDTYNWGVAITQNLFAGFRHEGELESAYANQAQNIADIILKESDISSQLKIAFSNILYLKEYVELTKKIEQRRTENFDIVRLRYESGNENKGSFLQAKAQLNEAIFDKKQAQRNLDASKYELAKILGRDSIIGLDIKGDVPHTKFSVQDKNKYMEDHPEILIAKANVALAKANVKIAESSVYPSVDVTAKTGGINGSTNEKIDNQIGINLTAPITTFGRNRNSILESKSLLSSSITQEIFVKQDVKSKIQDSASDLESARDNVIVREDLRKASEVRAEIGRSKYNIGMLTFENWDIIERDLISYQKQELLSKQELVTSEANWEKSLGKGVF